MGIEISKIVIFTHHPPTIFAYNMYKIYFFDNKESFNK